MNLSKVLKQKRDEEDRLRNRSPQTAFNETSPGEQSFVDTSKFATKTDLAGKADINHNHDHDYAEINHNHDLAYVKTSDYKQFEILTNGDSENPEVLFANGDILMVEVI